MQQISFPKVCAAIATLPGLSLYVGTVLSEEHFRVIAAQTYERVLRRRVRPRKKRVCPRKVRKQQKHWPKLRARTEAPLQVEITLLEPSKRRARDGPTIWDVSSPSAARRGCFSRAQGERAAFR